MITPTFREVLWRGRSAATRLRLTRRDPHTREDSRRRRARWAHNSGALDLPVRLSLVRVHRAGRRHGELPAAACRRRPDRPPAVRHADGTELEIGQGQAYSTEPGHDAWVVGDEPFVCYDFEPRAAATYARP
jgi:hypothetical protein